LTFLVFSNKICSLLKRRCGKRTATEGPIAKSVLFFCLELFRSSCGSKRINPLLLFVTVMPVNAHCQSEGYQHAAWRAALDTGGTPFGLPRLRSAQIAPARILKLSSGLAGNEYSLSTFILSFPHQSITQNFLGSITQGKRLTICRAPGDVSAQGFGQFHR